MQAQFPDATVAGQVSASRLRLLLLRMIVDPQFVKYWIGQTLSQVGSQVTMLALPLAAISAIGSSAGEVGLLRGLETAPFLLFSLAAGAWADRVRRRLLLISADVARAVVLALVPAAALIGLLRIELLYAVAFCVGVAGTLEQTATTPYLSTLLPAEKRLVANSRLQASGAVVGIVGPGLAGVLIAILTAPIAIAIDILSFVASALMLMSIRRREAAAVLRSSRPLWAEIAEGVAFITHTPFLRGIALFVVTANLFGSAVYMLFLVFATRDLGLSPIAIGAVFSLGAPAALLGALAAPRISGQFGLQRTVALSGSMVAIGWSIFAFAAAVAAEPLLLIMSGYLISSFWMPVVATAIVTTQQQLVPPHLLGRVVAAVSAFSGMGSTALGAIAGGITADLTSVPFALVVSALGMLLGALYLSVTMLRLTATARTA